MSTPYISKNEMQRRMMLLQQQIELTTAMISVHLAGGDITKPVPMEELKKAGVIIVEYQKEGDTLSVTLKKDALDTFAEQMVGVGG